MNLLLKIVAFISVFAIIVLGFGIEFYAMKETYSVISLIVKGYSEEDKVVEKSLHCLDMILLGTVFVAIACSLFELFIKELNNLPSWLKVKDLDDLKAMIIKMVIVVMTISLTGKIITWNGTEEIMYLGIGFSAAVFSLGYFLWIKSKQ